MIDLYTYTTPNGRKVSVALEELGLPYTTKVVNLRKGEQFTPEFLAINPNNKIPAIVDHDVPGGLKVFESGAILIYLAEKTGRLMPSDAVGKAEVMQWLMFQMGGFGPMLGQLNYFTNLAPAHQRSPGAIERFHTEGARLVGVLDGHLRSRDFMARQYSIADIAMYPWAVTARELAPELFSSASGILQWMQRVGDRPAVQKGMKVPSL